MRVLMTAVKNNPSKRGSRLRRACSQTCGAGSVPPAGGSALGGVGIDFSNVMNVRLALRPGAGLAGFGHYRGANSGGVIGVGGVHPSIPPPAHPEPVEGQ